MSDELKPMSAFELAAADLEPPFNVYTGRDTSRFAMMFDTEDAVSRTQQEFADECDINNIMARYIKTGTVPMYLDRGMLDGDMHEMSYHDMQNVIADANSAFAVLPATVRASFDNDPAKFVDFALDDKNVNKLREWGMLSPEAVERLDAAEAARVAAEAVQASGSSREPAQGAPPASQPATQ